MRHTYSVFHEAHSGQFEENGVGSGTSISRFVGKLNMECFKADIDSLPDSYDTYDTDD